MKTQALNLKVLDGVLLILFVLLVALMIGVHNYYNSEMKRLILEHEIELIYIDALNYLNQNEVKNEQQR